MKRSLRVVYLLESTEPSSRVKVVLLQAEALARRGHRLAVVSPEPMPEWFRLSRAHFEHCSFRESRELARAEVRIATLWTTVFPALEDARGPVFHLCQGYEGGSGFPADRLAEIEAAYRAPTRKLAVSGALARRLEELGFGPVVDVGQAFDAKAFAPVPERQASGVPVILLVGPYEAGGNGIPAALEGLALWRERGGGFLLRRVSTRAITPSEKATGLVDEYHHTLAPDRMPFAYRASDIFLGPSRREGGLGLSLLEALACGLACLLSDTPGHREIAGTAAWYFRDGDAGSLADTLPQLLDGKARARARREGPQAAARFDVAEVASNLERAFRQALEGVSL